MCGIAGFLAFDKNNKDKAIIRRMTDALAHRGPDSSGVYDGEMVSLGHRRLSIIDLSSAADQPFTDISGRYVMVFNGEIYNYAEVRSLIKDYPFHTSSDTEVLIAAYAKWGADCIGYMRGMFAFAIWDHVEQELFLARDPMGVKPLYYYMDKGNFLFASEIRGILTSGLVERKADQGALLEYLSFQSVGSPSSIIRNIDELEAGSFMRVKNGEIVKRRYWEVTADGMSFNFTDAKAIQRHIKDLMLKSVERRLVSDVPVGAFLSGGIDSGAVVGLMAEVGEGRPETFNVCFQEKEFDESGYAELIAKKFDTRHHRILMRPETMLDELENALAAMDTPSGDGINTYVVSKAVRRNGITVALSGVGGDELFAGYPFFLQYLQLQNKRWLWQIPRLARKTITGTLLGGATTGRKGRIRQLLSADSPAIWDAYPVFRQILSPEHVGGLTMLKHSGGFATALQQELAGRKDHLQKLPLLSQVSAAEYLGYTQHTLLKDTDQMSMAVALEVREPFFDQDLVEFVLSIPDVFKKPVYAKSLLVESLKPLLPDEVVFRKKQGFLFPWSTWLRYELRSFCDTRIRNMADRQIIKGKELIAYWERFLAGDPHIRWVEIWLFVVLEHWLEKNDISC